MTQPLESIIRRSGTSRAATNLSDSQPPEFIMPSRSPFGKSRRPRLAILLLEDRSVPAAFNLLLDGDMSTSNVTATGAGSGTITFTSTGLGAILDVDDIETQLNAGNNVVI